MAAPVVPLLRACHPEPTVAVTSVTAALAAAAGRSAAGVAAVAVAVLAGQLSVGWSNDYVDRDRDARGGRPDKPVAVGAVAAPTVRVAALAALAASLPLSLLSGWRATLAHLAAIALGWAYNLGLKATPLSVVAYAVAFALLPAFVVLGLPGAAAPPWWAVAGGGLLGAGAHFANVLPDLAEDERSGIRGLPHRLGAVRSRRAAAGLLVLASVVVALGPGVPGPLVAGGLAVAVALVLAGVALERRLAGRGAFRVTLAVALLDVALLVAQGRALA